MYNNNAAPFLRGGKHALFRLRAAAIVHKNNRALPPPIQLIQQIQQLWPGVQRRNQQRNRRIYVLDGLLFRIFHRSTPMISAAVPHRFGTKQQQSAGTCFSISFFPPQDKSRPFPLFTRIH